jgi:hypothetical protein
VYSIKKEVSPQNYKRYSSEQYRDISQHRNYPIINDTVLICYKFFLHPFQRKRKGTLVLKQLKIFSEPTSSSSVTYSTNSFFFTVIKTNFRAHPFPEPLQISLFLQVDH